jgi:hypothetical protein
VFTEPQRLAFTEPATETPIGTPIIAMPARPVPRYGIFSMERRRIDGGAGVSRLDA